MDVERDSDLEDLASSSLIKKVSERLPDLIHDVFAELLFSFLSKKRSLENKLEGSGSASPISRSAGLESERLCFFIYLQQLKRSCSPNRPQSAHDRLLDNCVTLPEVCACTSLSIAVLLTLIPSPCCACPFSLSA